MSEVGEVIQGTDSGSIFFDFASDLEFSNDLEEIMHLCNKKFRYFKRGFQFHSASARHTIPTLVKI